MAHHAHRAVPLRIAVLVGVGGFVVGLAVPSLVDVGAERATTAPTPPSRTAPREATAAADPGPRSVEQGIPSGFGRTREGAVAAAASYATTGQALLDIDPLAAEEAVRQMAAEATADAQVAETLTDLQRVRSELAGGSGPIIFRQAVVAYRIEAWSPERARVAIYNVGVLARDGVAPPQAGWAISTYELVWERGDWKIAARTIVPGPAPILNDSAPPATAAQLARALDGFIDFGGQR